MSYTEENIVTENRVGVFRINASSIRGNSEALINIWKHFVIVKAEMDFCSDTIEYTAYSKLFPKQPTGSLAPRYKVYLSMLSTTDEYHHIEGVALDV